MTLKNSSSKKYKKNNGNDIGKKRKDRKLKNSLSNILREDRKRRIWPMVLFGLICFLMTAAFELNLESYIARELAFVKIQENIERLTKTGMLSTYLIVAGAGACLFGFQGFGWLMKRDQVDFYHSQPMKRGERFKVIYLNGVLMCLVPMFIHVAIYALLIGLRGFLNLEVLLNILLNAGIFVIGFLIMYHLVILAVMLAGNILVSYMLAGVMFTYASVIKYLVETFLGNYFETYVANYTDAVGWMGYISPIEQLYRVADWFVRGFREDINIMMHLLILAIMAVAFLAAALGLYKKRPSEAAGNALAFPYMGDWIRFMMVIPIGMMFGTVFSAVGVMSNVFWLYFGAIVGVVLVHGFLEVVFHFDIKAALGKKRQLALSAILVLCIMSVFHFDLIGYDTYIPEKSKVKTAAYYLNIGEYNSNYRILSEDGTPIFVNPTNTTIGQEIPLAETSSYGTYTLDIPTGSSIYRDDYQLKASRTEEIDPILNLIQAHMEYSPKDNQDRQRVEMIVQYEMNSGREVYRRYDIDMDVLMEYYEPIYNTEEGKQVIYPYLSLSGDGVQEVYVQNVFAGDKLIGLTTDEIQELTECYKKDIRSQSLSDLIHDQYVGQIQFVYGQSSHDNKSSNDDKISLTFYIAKNHKNMMDFFKKRNIYFTLPNDEYDIIEISLFNPYGMEATENHPFWKGREQVTLTPEQAQELIPYMISDKYYNGYYRDYFLSGDVVVENKKTGVKQQIYCNVSEGYVPDYAR